MTQDEREGAETRLREAIQSVLVWRMEVSDERNQLEGQLIEAAVMVLRDELVRLRREAEQWQQATARAAQDHASAVERLDACKREAEAGWPVEPLRVWAAAELVAADALVEAEDVGGSRDIGRGMAASLTALLKRLPALPPPPRGRRGGRHEAQLAYR